MRRIFSPRKYVRVELEKRRWSKKLDPDWLFLFLPSPRRLKGPFAFFVSLGNVRGRLVVSGAQSCGWGQKAWCGFICASGVLVWLLVMVAEHDNGVGFVDLECKSYEFGD